MSLPKPARILLILFVLVLNIGCDQATKSIARKIIAEDDRIVLCDEHLTLMRSENTGAFLSLGAGLSDSTRAMLLSLLPMLALGFGLFFVLTRGSISNTVAWGMGCLLGGGIGNVYDRMVHGSVTDFLYLHFGPLHTGVFNLADMSIVIGMLILVGHSLVVRASRSAD
jgi:signal peptidase II